MAKIEKVDDKVFAGPELRISRRKSRRLSALRMKSADMSVRCGCGCDEVVVISYDERAINIHASTLEINGVTGTIDQWRRVLLPVLGLVWKEILPERVLVDEIGSD